MRKQHFLDILFGLSLFYAVSAARAEVMLEPSPVWRQAHLVAPGQQVWSFENSYQSYDSRFGQLGDLQSLGQPYGRMVTWGRLLQSEPTAEGQAEIRDYMRRSSLLDSDVAANASYQVRRQEMAMNIRWAHGLTRRWMIGFQVPLVIRKTMIARAIHLRPALAQVQARVLRASVASGAVGGRIRDLAESELSSSGYDQIPSQVQRWDWGDISLISQIILAEGYRWTWALQQSLRLPTARNASLADFIQTNSDDGQFDMALSSLLDYRHRRWVLSQRMGVVAQLPDHIRVRAPVRDANGSTDTVSIGRDLGDYFWGSLQGEYKMTSRMSVGLEYAFLSKTSDQYSKVSSQEGYYTSLGSHSDQELHVTRIGLNYRLGDRSARSGVENKWLAALGYTVPWAGRNTIDASRASFEMTKYF